MSDGVDWSKAKRQFRYMLLLTSSHSAAEPTNTHLNPYTFFFDSFDSFVFFLSIPLDFVQSFLDS